jgi:hypothetical protein
MKLLTKYGSVTQNVLFGGNAVVTALMSYLKMATVQKKAV